MAIVFSWSGGKDSTLALHELLKNKQPVKKLLTTVTADYDRISIHGVRRALLKAQADSIGLSLDEISLFKKSSDDDYEQKMKTELKILASEGVDFIAFGDIYLQWLKEKRITLAESAGMKCIFPIWKRDTKELANTFIDLGYKAVLTCVDSNVLGESFAGRDFDKKLLSELPENVDPCGENGEFHSFVYEGPIFNKRIRFQKGETVFREERFYYSDLIPEL